MFLGVSCWRLQIDVRYKALRMQRATAIIGALFVFIVVFFVADFFVAGIGESFPDWALIAGMMGAAAVAFIAAASSYRASLRSSLRDRTI